MEARTLAGRKGSENARAGSTPDQPRRGGSPRAIAQMVPKLTQKALGKRGLAEANLVTDWSTIVGAERAKTCQPEKLSFPRGQRHQGTLYLRATSGAAIEVQHDAPALIERINGYFGYAAVTDIRLVQAPLKLGAAPAPPRPKREPSAAERASLDAHLQSVEDPELRVTLNRLGMAVLSESADSTKK